MTITLRTLPDTDVDEFTRTNPYIAHKIDWQRLLVVTKELARRLAPSPSLETKGQWRVAHTTYGWQVVHRPSRKEEFWSSEWTTVNGRLVGRHDAPTSRRPLVITHLSKAVERSNMRTRLSVLCWLAALLLGAFIAPAAATAAPAASPATTALHANPVAPAAAPPNTHVHRPTNGAIAPVEVNTPDGKVVVSWHAASKPQTVPQSSTVTPDSASGCNQDVCIQIRGYSNYISYWGTTGFNDGPVCSWPDWWFPSQTVVATADILCVDSAGVFVGDWYPNRKFTPNPALACNSFWGIPGFPCEMIRK